jgi:phosphoesterase RecJ-like protein
MNIYKQIVETLKNSNHIVITSHKSPDGDSIGSSIALYEFCKQLGKTAYICHPDPSPDFLNWLPATQFILNFEENEAEVTNQLNKADVIFSLDYNDSSRLGASMQSVFDQSNAAKIMIDHHLNPADFALYRISETQVCSTSQLIYDLIEYSENLTLLNTSIGTAIYLGIMTDTGSFRFPSVQVRTHQILANLLAIGVKHYEIHENVFDTNTLDRLRLRGYACSEKLEILTENQVAIISLTQHELQQFNHQKGDTEGLVNVALSIEGMRAAVMFTEADGYVKISFRSKGKENPVNQLASDHFQGGGHANAAGGRFDGSLDEAINIFKTVISDYIKPNRNV